ncbi:MAG: adenylate/guanylate cyclase domain-containing protein [Moraxellaceae bacterium]|nr:adenylate/guanylate cyclase domain-containing protein [Moraxellaceae bacterium]
MQRIGPIIRQHNGFIDKYMGDGIMALFPRTPDDAILAAIEMRKKLIDYNIERVKWRQVEINTGIGIHVGTLMLGTIGEDKRMQGTVISDAVNLASRLESMTKDFGISILISKEVFNRLESPEKYKHRFLGNTNVKGKMESIPFSKYMIATLMTSLDLKT